jgi:hypothetical protein
MALDATYYNEDRNVYITGVITASTTLPLMYPYTKYTIQVTPTGGACSVAASVDGETFVTWDAGSIEVSTVEICDAVTYLKIELSTATQVNVAIWGSGE